MIIDAILNLFFGIVNLLLAPLELVNIAVDFTVSFSVVSDFLTVIIFVLPWNNLQPLIFLTISIFSFRIVISLVKTIMDIIPFA